MAICKQPFDLELCPKSENGLKFNFFLLCHFGAVLIFFDKVLGPTVVEIEPFQVMT